MTTREIHLATLHGFTAEMSSWAGDFVTDFDWDEIRNDYNEALAKLAPEGVAWGWTEQGVYCYADLDVDPETVYARWREIVFQQLIDFEAIATKHDRLSRVCVCGASYYRGCFCHLTLREFLNSPNKKRV